jgi:hypothetical protein
MSLEFVRKTGTFRTSLFNSSLFSQVFVNKHLQQNDVFGEISPFLEHLSVRKGCQQAWPSAASQRRAKALSSVVRPFALVRRFASIDPYEENLVPAAFFRAAARSLVVLVLATPAERRNNLAGGACHEKGGPGTEAGSITMRLLNWSASGVGAGTPRVEGWRARQVRRLDIYHRESEKHFLRKKKKGFLS